MDHFSSLQINRKPLPSPGQHHPAMTNPGLQRYPTRNPLFPRDDPGLALQTNSRPVELGVYEDVDVNPPPYTESAFDIVHQQQQQQPVNPPATPGSSHTSLAANVHMHVALDETSTVVVENQDKQSFLKTAIDEALYFANGLIPRPHESTKHYTILRHSPSIVFYRGPTTSVAVTIFSSSQPNTPLSRDRSIWLQQRGYSGDTGMKLKRLVGATADWLDVTPTVQVPETDVDVADERAWQRDIGRFMKKYAKQNTGHVPRETLVIRLPVMVEDGYFRLVLCTGGVSSSSSTTTTTAAKETGKYGPPVRKRKVLCSSPIFRVASVSTDPSILRGASLKTLPLELGVRVGSTFTVNKIMGFVSPVATKIQGRLEKLQPSQSVTMTATTAYGASGLQERFDASAAQYDQTKHTIYDIFGPIQEGDNINLDIVGSDEGPESPYPLKFSGKVGRGTGARINMMGLPTANIEGASDDIKLRLRGVYMGWVCITTNARDLDSSISRDWHEAIISAGPSRNPVPSVVAENVIAVHIIHDFGAHKLFSGKLDIIVMGFLRPVDIKLNREEMEVAISKDIQITLSSLSRHKWGHDMARRELGTLNESKTFSDKYVSARQQLQRRADSVPLHWAGVRTSGAELRDRAIGQGGYWVSRS